MDKNSKELMHEKSFGLNFGIPDPDINNNAFNDSDDMFKDLSEKSLAGIYLIQDGIFKYGNPRFAEIFGYRVEEVIDILGPKDMVLPEDWQLVNENIRKRVLGEAEAIHYEFRGITKTKETINIEVYGSRIMYQGRPAVIGTLLDITKRKRAESLLKQAEEKYRGIFENAAEGIFQTTADGNFIVTNPALEQMLGYTSSKDLKTSITDISNQLYVDNDSRLKLFQILEQIGIALGFETQFYKKNKEIIWVSINARAVFTNDGKIDYYEGTVKDITEEKKAKDELRRVNEFNSAIINNSPVAIFTLDKNGLFVSVNPALAVLSGLGDEAEKHLIGFNWPKDPYTIKCGLAYHIEKGLMGEPFQLWDFPYITYRGDRNLYLDFKGVPIKGKDGNIEGLLCIIEESTDRVKTRARLMQEARMSAIGRLAAGIAHELNNPLATLVAHTELAGHSLEALLESDNKERELEELKKYLNIIETQAFRCKNVTSDILTLPWKEGFDITDVDINKLINNILEFTNLEQSNCKIIKELDPGIPPVKGDIGALRQVFSNLIHNAFDAVEGMMDAAVCIRTKADNLFILIEVEDNGSGIPDSIAEKIFEPFFTTKESKKGIGLGLSLCYEFIKHMKGNIRAESKPGCGAKFFVSLPTET